MLVMWSPFAASNRLVRRRARRKADHRTCESPADRNDRLRQRCSPFEALLMHARAQIAIIRMMANHSGPAGRLTSECDIDRAVLLLRERSLGQPTRGM